MARYAASTVQCDNFKAAAACLRAANFQSNHSYTYFLTTDSTAALLEQLALPFNYNEQLKVGTFDRCGRMQAHSHDPWHETYGTATWYVHF